MTTSRFVAMLLQAHPYDNRQLLQPVKTSAHQAADEDMGQNHQCAIISVKPFVKDWVLRHSTPTKELPDVNCTTELQPQVHTTPCLN